MLVLPPSEFSGMIDRRVVSFLLLTL